MPKIDLLDPMSAVDILDLLVMVDVSDDETKNIPLSDFLSKLPAGYIPGAAIAAGYIGGVSHTLAVGATDVTASAAEVNDICDGMAKSIDGTFAANSDTKYPTEKATKTYIAAQDSTKISNSVIDANSILYGVSDNTPAALSVPASSFVGRKATGDIVALTVPEAVSLLSLGNWTQTSGTFTATPASTSTLTMTTDLTATLLIGTPVKYIYDTGGGNITYYGIVSAIAANLLTVAGAPFDTGHDVTALYYADPVRTQQFDIIINGFYEDAANNTLIYTDIGVSLLWFQSKAYCVMYKVYSKTHDAGASHGKVTVLIDGSDVNSAADGLTIADDATWYSTVVDINTSNYDINYGEAIELSVTKGTNGDAADLIVSMIFVFP